MDIIKTSDFFVRKEGVWVTALGGLVRHVCASFIANRHYNARIQTDKGQRSVCLVCPGMKRVGVWYRTSSLVSRKTSSAYSWIIFALADERMGLSVRM